MQSLVSGGEDTNEFIPPGRIRLIGPMTLNIVTLFFRLLPLRPSNLNNPYSSPHFPASLVPATGLLEGQILQVSSVLSPAAEAWSVYQRLCCITSYYLVWFVSMFFMSV
jgi:hypothetical protein